MADMVQLPASYDSLYLTYGDKRSRSFIFVEYEDDQYRLEHDTPELGLELTNVARVSQQVARDILIRFSKEHTVILDGQPAAEHLEVIRMKHSGVFLYFPIVRIFMQCSCVTAERSPYSRLR